MHKKTRKMGYSLTEIALYILSFYGVFGVIQCQEINIMGRIFTVQDRY